MMGRSPLSEMNLAGMVYEAYMRIATAMCRRYERRPVDVGEVERKMRWKKYTSVYAPWAALVC